MTQRDSETGGDASAGEDLGFRVSDRRWWADDGGAREDEAPATGKPSYIEQLERDLASKDEQLQETLRQYREVRDEFERAKGRIERESARELARARLDFLRGFLGVLDDLDRALDAAHASPDPASLRNGVELVQRRFLAALREQGVVRIDPQGAPFDPRLHEAISTVPVDAEEQDGRVIAVVEAGYTAGDDILRPARVTVGKRASDGAASSQ